MRRRWPISAGVALLVVVPAAWLGACGGDGEDVGARALTALARVPIADAYELRVALREPGGRRRILRVTVDARAQPRPSGTWRAAYEIDVAGRPRYGVESAARRGILSVSVGRRGSGDVPSEVGRRVTYASRIPARVLDSPFVLAPYDRATLDPALWVDGLEPGVAPTAGVSRVEGPVVAQALLDDARRLLRAVVGPDPAGDDADATGGELALDVAGDGTLAGITASTRIEGGGRVSVQLQARQVGRGGLEVLRATAGAPLRRLPEVMRGAVPPRVRTAFGVDDPR